MERPQGRLARGILWFTVAVALAVFCVVQDRVTAAGARRYVALQRAALARGGPLVTIDAVMQPAIDESVRLGLIASGAVAAVGVAAALAVRRRWPHA